MTYDIKVTNSEEYEKANLLKKEIRDKILKLKFDMFYAKNDEKETKRIGKEAYY